MLKLRMYKITESTRDVCMLSDNVKAWLGHLLIVLFVEVQL